MLRNYTIDVSFTSVEMCPHNTCNPKKLTTLSLFYTIIICFNYNYIHSCKLGHHFICREQTILDAVSLVCDNHVNSNSPNNYTDEEGINIIKKVSFKEWR